MGDEDDTNHYEVNMEKIMARFTNFNQLITSTNSNNDDDEEEEEDKKEENERDGEEEETKDHDDSEKPTAHSPVKVLPTEYKEEEPLNTEFLSSNYWKIEGSEVSIDDLLEEMKLWESSA